MILILDFGSQYTQLIARRVREAKVYCEIHPYNITLERIRQLQPEGIILSGGPASVYAEDAPMLDARVLDIPVPILGICYGMNVLFQLANGVVTKADRREFGSAELIVDETNDLFAGFTPGSETRVWMSHGDKMESLPRGWRSVRPFGEFSLCGVSRRFWPFLRRPVSPRSGAQRTWTRSLAEFSLSHLSMRT